MHDPPALFNQEQLIGLFEVSLGEGDAARVRIGAIAQIVRGDADERIKAPPLRVDPAGVSDHLKQLRVRCSILRPERLL